MSIVMQDKLSPLLSKIWFDYLAGLSRSITSGQNTASQYLLRAILHHELPPQKALQTSTVLIESALLPAALATEPTTILNLLLSTASLALLLRRLMLPELFRHARDG